MSEATRPAAVTSGAHGPRVPCVARPFLPPVLALALSLLALAWLAGFPRFACAATDDACVSCHRELRDKRLAGPARGMDVDVHLTHGVSCADCHGGNSFAVGDMSAAHSSSAGFRGVPGVLSVPDFCGGCHSNPAFMKKHNPNIGVDQLELYRTSVHGIKNRAGDKNVAQCVSCHGVHGIRPSNDPLSPIYPSNVPHTCGKCHDDEHYMKSYGIPTDQMKEYRDSVHGKALLIKGDRASPACNDCHGNHGAVPPGVGSISEVCGQCHAAQAALFSASPHKAAYATLGLPACETCHGNHSVRSTADSLLGVSQGSVCINCHDEGSNGYAVASRLSELIEGVRTRHESVTRIVDRAEQAGMTMDQAKFDLNEARNALMRGRTAIHASASEAVELEVAPGGALLASTEKSANKALAEISSRRKWLGVLVVAVIIMIIALYRKLREVDAQVK